MYQTKVSKLVVEIGDDDDEDRQRTDRRQLVRVRSWTDRRDSNGGGRSGDVPKDSAVESPDNVPIMPSVKELAKQFSSHYVSIMMSTIFILKFKKIINFIKI